MNNPGNGHVGKNVINTHLHMQNVVDMKLEENKQIFTDTLEYIDQLLTPHCGPHSQFSMIVDRNVIASGNAALASPSTFSKDGITILEKVEFASIIQTYLKNVITYIGREVDRRAKDGTTTAMLVAAIFLKNALQNKDKIAALKLTTVDQNKLYKEFVKIVLETIDNESYSIERLMSLYPGKSEEYWAGVIAFMQSMSSSGGHLILSKCMKTIFEGIPREAWEHQTWFSSKVEDETDYSVHTEPYDFVVDIDFQTANLYNEVMQTEWVKENVRVLAIPDGMATGDTCTSKLIGYIKAYPENESLCILTAAQIPAEIIRTVGEVNAIRKEPIALASYFTKNKTFTQYAVDLAVLNAIASTTPYIQTERQNPLDDSYTFMVNKIRTYGSVMEFYGLFEHDATKATIHPNFKHPGKCKFYDDLLEDMKLRAEQADLSHAKDQSVHDIATLAMKNMTCIHLPTLKLGGNTHDNVAAHHVVRDVIGATMASITNNFFINGVLSMNDVLVIVKEKIENDNFVMSEVDKKYMLFIHENFRLAINHVIKTLYDENIYNTNDIIVPNTAKHPQEYINALAPEGVVNDLDMYLEYLELEEDDNVLIYGYPVIQPVLIYHEILSRVGELIIKLMATDKVIVPGGVYMKSVSGNAS